MIFLIGGRGGGVGQLPNKNSCTRESNKKNRTKRATEKKHMEPKEKILARLGTEKIKKFLLRKIVQSPIKNIMVHPLSPIKKDKHGHCPQNAF